MTTRPRCVRIFSLESGKLLAVREATSLKQGLKDYYNETLSKTCHNPRTTGNTLSVLDEHDNPRIYVAKDAV